MLEHKLRRLLADQRLSRFGGGGARGVTSRSTKESHRWSRSERWERRPAGHDRPDYQDVNISFNLGQPQSSKLSGNAKEEGLDVTLDDPAVQRTQMGLDEWSDASADSSGRWITSWTARISRSRQVKIIPQAENTSEHKYNQAECLSITTKGYIANNTKSQALRFQY